MRCNEIALFVWDGGGGGGSNVLKLSVYALTRNGDKSERRRLNRAAQARGELRVPHLYRLAREAAVPFGVSSGQADVMVDGIERRKNRASIGPHSLEKKGAKYSPAPACPMWNYHNDSDWTSKRKSKKASKPRKGQGN